VLCSGDDRSPSPRLSPRPGSAVCQRHRRDRCLLPRRRRPPTKACSWVTVCEASLTMASPGRRVTYNLRGTRDPSIPLYPGALAPGRRLTLSIRRPRCPPPLFPASTTAPLAIPTPDTRSQHPFPASTPGTRSRHPLPVLAPNTRSRYPLPGPVPSIYSRHPLTIPASDTHFRYPLRIPPPGTHLPVHGPASLLLVSRHIFRRTYSYLSASTAAGGIPLDAGGTKQ